MARQLHLIGHVCTGPTNHHNGSWRHPDSDADRVLDASRYEDLGRLYERGMFDGAFIVDYQCIPDLTDDSESLMAKRGGQLAMLDPVLVLVAMARVTRHLGLAATASTSLNHPYHIARMFATLDHLSGGRAGWNIVTSTYDQEARCYGSDKLPDRAIRYDQADETVEACIQLWNSWEPGAFIADRKSGVFADPKKIHHVKYEGAYVRSEGALTTPSSPQGQPVFMQAGSSERGLEFAARWAECVFTNQQEKSRMQAFYADLKDRVGTNGRDPHSCAILPSIEVIVGETESEAQQRADYLDSLATPEMGLSVISDVFKRDLSQVPLDTPLADIALGEGGPSSIGSFKNMISTTTNGRGLTLREAALVQATTWWAPRLVGSPSMIADHLQDLFETECCDGFIITQAMSPGGLERFVDGVVPELQRRGIYRREYTGRTFRENLQG